MSETFCEGRVKIRQHQTRASASATTSSVSSIFRGMSVADGATVGDEIDVDVLLSEVVETGVEEASLFHEGCCPSTCCD